MTGVPVDSQVLQRAVAIYLQQAYAGGVVPAAVEERRQRVAALPPGAAVPESLFEVASSGARRTFALRLGQPLYPHMKLVIENRPEGDGFIFRADGHDAHLQAPPDSPDAPLLARLRQSNQQVVEKIEAAWDAADVPTFRNYLRQQLMARRAGR
jgi:hypothetical protein